jgi:hypothetical protein
MGSSIADSRSRTKATNYTKELRRVRWNTSEGMNLLDEPLPAVLTRSQKGNETQNFRTKVVKLRSEDLDLPQDCHSSP